MTTTHRRPRLAAAMALLAIGTLLLDPRPPTLLAATEVPAPENGLVAFAAGGDIWVTDATPGGEARVLIGGPETDLAPRWSPDGSRIAFVRDGGSVMVADADGRNVRELWAGDPDQWANGPEEAVLAWSPDGSTLLVDGFQARSVWLVPVDGRGEPVKAVPFEADWAAWRPGGTGFIVRRSTDGDVGLVPVSWPDLVVGEPIITANPSISESLHQDMSDLREPAFSPDGSHILVLNWPFGRGGLAGLEKRRVYVLDTDGSDLRLLELDPAADQERLPSFSPDSRRVVMFSLAWDKTTDTYIPNARIAILTLDGSAPPIAFPAPEAVTEIRWSPDGTQLLVIQDDGRASLFDPATGAQTQLPWSTGSSAWLAPEVDWQRVPG